MASKDTGIVNIHGKEYKTVAARVQEFRTEYQDAYAIVTEIVERTEELVVVKASVIKNVMTTADVLHTYPIATGYAEEKRNASSINRTSALENAETSAIGRALAAFGMAGSEYASADEVAQAIHQQGNAPQEFRPFTEFPPSVKQLDMIRRLSQQLGIDDAIVETRMTLLSNKAEASEAIDKLQQALKKKEGESED